MPKKYEKKKQIVESGSYPSWGVDNTVTRIGNVSSTASNGETVSLSVDGFKSKQLARLMANSWQSVSSGLSRSRVFSSRQALYSFLSFIDVLDEPITNVMAQDGRITQALVAWSQSVKSSYSTGSNMPYLLTGCVQNILLHVLNDIGYGDGPLRKFVEGASLVEKACVAPLDEFSKLEMKCLIRSARKHVRFVEEYNRWANQFLTEVRQNMGENSSLKTFNDLLEKARVLKLQKNELDPSDFAAIE